MKREDGGFRLIEVKSSKSVKNHHISDVALQAYVLRQNGIDIVGTDLMYLNGECAFPDLSNLFIREDVTSAVHAMEPSVPTWIADQLEMLKSTLPDVKIGPHCTAPYECPFIARCWPRLPPNHVSTLYAMKKRALELDEQGYRTIYDLPEDVPLKPIADRQRRAVREDRMIVEPTLARALDFFVPPIAFIDFETVGLAIPVWNGCHPYDAVPVQFSCHLQQVDGHVAHHAWLSGGPEDPRPRFAERLIAACEGAQTVVAYNTSFERNCLEQLADALPALAPQLQNIAGRLVDLLPIVREHVYHPNFGGSFTLKSVLPALLPEVTYEDLAIADGATASLELERLLLSQNLLTREAKEELRKNLLRYCEQDSWALVKLLERFRQLVGDQQAK